MQAKIIDSVSILLTYITCEQDAHTTDFYATGYTHSLLATFKRDLSEILSFERRNNYELGSE